MSAEPPGVARRRHHTKAGEPIRADDPEQVIWCPNVEEWMTRAEHAERFRSAHFGNPQEGPMTDSTPGSVRRVPALHIPCPRCGARAGELCRRLSPGRFTHVDNPHQARTEEAKTTDAGATDG